MAYRIQAVEGIGPAFEERLKAAKIITTNDLLNMCGDAKGRKRTAEQTGLRESQLLKWTNMADLMRISGVGSQYSELLEAAGVDTVKELRNRNAAALADKLKSINAEKKLARTVPSRTAVERWVQQAKLLPPVMSY
jgi:predicted flap endonuclease-1-like 5' DNA nuclease